MSSANFMRWKLRIRRSLNLSGSGLWLAGGIALIAALATGQNPTAVQLLERNVQTSFFDFRGPVAPPGEDPQSPTEPGIVILAMDSETMTQGIQMYANEPKQYAYFEPIQQWPWQRTAYAISIERLMQAGARAVVLDVVLDANSSYGAADDERLRQVLQKYAGRVTLAAKYSEEEKRTGFEIKLLTPNPVFESAAPRQGFINLPLSANGRIHEYGQVFLQSVQQNYTPLGIAVPSILSLAEAALQAGDVSYPTPENQTIFFYGPSQTFKHIPFWHVLDPENWNGYLKDTQTFKNKIVLIGPTAGGELFQDFHAAPFSGTLRYPEKMAGVEIQANAIASLMQGRSINPVFSQPLLQGLFVASFVLLVSYLHSRQRERQNPARLLRRFGYGVAIAFGYGIFSYTLFVQGRLSLPTAVPMLAIVASSATFLATGVIEYQRSVRRDAKRTFETSTTQADASDFENPDMQEVFEQGQQEFMGSTLGGRYKVGEQIGVGGFGETYRAEDLGRPGSPLCVVKRLRPQSKSRKVLKLAESLFEREAIVLQKLGHHDQIPDLLAYLEEKDEFYLVQQFIDGRSLAEELRLPKLLRPLSEQAVVVILYDLLRVLAFVHQQGVIHRDIKPANIIRRNSDRRLVLIDFGAVKQVRGLEELEDGTVLTVPIGTNGYMAPEQAMGMPCPASDIYSLGMTGIRALTGIEPKNLHTNQSEPNEGVDWRENVQASDALIQILEKMTRIDVKDRYQTVQEVMTDLQPLIEFVQKAGYTPEFLESPAAIEEEPLMEETQQWMADLPEIELPPTDPEEALDPTAQVEPEDSIDPTAQADPDALDATAQVDPDELLDPTAHVEPMDSGDATDAAKLDHDDDTQVA